MIIIGLVVVNFLKDIVIKTVITSVGSNIVGAPIKIGRFSLGLFTQKIRMFNFKLYNPKGFPHELMIDLPEVSVDYNSGALLGGKLHCPFLAVDLKEMVVIRNKEGKLNVDSLKIIEEQKRNHKKSELMPIQIDVMKLNVDRVIFKDFSKGDQPNIQVFDVGLRDKTFRNISSVPQMVTLIMAQAMSQTAIKSVGVYAAASVLGVGFIPAGVVGALMGSDEASAEFNKSFDRVFQTTLDFLKSRGEIKSEDKATGLIKAKMQGTDLTIQVSDVEGKGSVTVSARQMLLPKPEVAAGIIYQLQQQLK